MKHIFLVAWLVGLFAAHACRAQHAAPHIEPRFAVGVVMSEQLARSEVGVLVRAMLHDATLVPDDGSVRFTTTTFGDNGTGCGDLASAMECAASTLKLSAPDAYRHVFVIVDGLPLEDDAAMQRIRDARNTIIGRADDTSVPNCDAALAHQINAIALTTCNELGEPIAASVRRSHVKEHITESVVQFGPIDGEYNIGMAAEATDRHLLMPVYDDGELYWPAGALIGASLSTEYLAPDTRTHVTSDQGSGGTLPPMFDQINAIAMNHYTAGVGLAGIVERDDMFNDVTDSNIKISPPVNGEKNIGFAAEARGTSTVLSAWLTTIADNGEHSFESILDRMFLRMTVCPGDYNRDGTVNSSQTTPGADFYEFIQDYGSSALYADWNFDGGYDAGTNPLIHGDAAKFAAGFLAGCP